MAQHSTRSRWTRNFDPYFWVGCLSVLVLGGALLWTRAGASTDEFMPVDIPDRLLVQLEASGLASHLGREDAPVRVVELFDYQCPACAAAHAANWPLIRRYAAQGGVRFTVYDVPLPRHANAIPAGVAASCVSGASPAVFWDYHQRLLASQGAWESSPNPHALFVQIAADAGADTTSLRSCIRGEAQNRSAALEQAWQLGASAGITYSPVWEVNGKPIRWNEVPSEIEAALARAR